MTFEKRVSSQSGCDGSVASPEMSIAQAWAYPVINPPIPHRDDMLKAIERGEVVVIGITNQGEAIYRPIYG